MEVYGAWRERTVGEEGFRARREWWVAVKVVRLKLAWRREVEEDLSCWREWIEVGVE